MGEINRLIIRMPIGDNIFNPQGFMHILIAVVVFRNTGIAYCLFGIHLSFCGYLRKR